MRSVSVDDACELVTDGTHYTPPNVGQGIPFLTVKDVTDAELDFERCSFISEADFQSARAGNSAPRVGDILFSKDGTVGKVHVVATERPFAVLSSLAILRPRHGVVDSKYFGHALRWPTTIDQALKRKTGSAIRRIILGDLKQVRVPLPPLPEQRRIAEVLDRAETLRAQRRQALAQLDALAEAIFLDMFGDASLNPGGLPRVALGDLIVSGPQNGLYKPSTDYGSGTPILRIDAFYDGEVTKLNALKRVRVTDAERATFALTAGDLVINRVNSPEYLGKSALIPALPEPTIFESNMMRMRLDKRHIAPAYAVRFLQTPFFRSQVRTASKDAVNQSSINQQDVKRFQINLPPLNCQHEFVAALVQVSKVKLWHRKSQSELNTLFASLQHRAFRGEL